MKLLDRLQSESSELGKWFTLKIPFILAGLAGLTETLEYTNSLPEGLVPEWVKQSLLCGVLAGKLIGHFTVKKDI